MAQNRLFPSLYRGRDAIAALPSALVLLALIGGGFKQAHVIRYHDDKPVAVALVDPVVVPPPEPPQPEPPKPVEQPRPAPQQAPTPTPQQPVPVVTNAPTPAASQPVVDLPKPAPVSPPPTPAPAPQPHVSTPDAAAEYIGKVRAQLNAIKRYPTGREASQQHPQGKVKLWFVLRRDGSVADFGIEESSNSMLLDDAARKTLNRANFPAFPEQSWNGESTHRFSAELEFVPPA
jgi:protein TonB